MYVLVSVHMCVYVCKYTHTYIFHHEVKWSLDNYSSKHPLRAGVCTFIRETPEKYQNHSS